MSSRDLTDVTLVSKDHDGPDVHNECDDPDYHDGHDDCDNGIYCYTMLIPGLCHSYCRQASPEVCRRLATRRRSSHSFKCSLVQIFLQWRLLDLNTHTS